MFRFNILWDQVPTSKVPMSKVARPDPKRYQWLCALQHPLTPLAAWGLVSLTAWGGFWWLGPLLTYVLVLPLDWLAGTDDRNRPEHQRELLERDRYYRWITYLYIPLHFTALITACWLWSRGGMSLIDKIGLAFTVGMSTGVGIATAHELGHKRPRLERLLSRIALAPAAYGHFYVEHNRGHHVRVATPEDPASAKLGEGFWAFLPRTVIGSARHAWTLERDRLQRHGARTWSAHNQVITAWAMTAILLASLTLVFGLSVLPFLVLQAAYGVSLLEAVNYIEHYGLLRQRDASGRYERVRPVHSWNSDGVAANLALFNLQRHSDHHANPTRRYPVLRHFDEAPELPTSYNALLGLVLVPPLWRRVMDPRVVAHYDGDINRANLHHRVVNKQGGTTERLPRIGIETSGSRNREAGDAAPASH